MCFRIVDSRWELVARCFRLDEDDPVAAWKEHIARLEARGKSLTDLKPDALHYRGPGTEPLPFTSPKH